MAQAQTLDSDGTFLVNRGGTNVSTDGGLQVDINVTGTNSLVLNVNTAPPGAVVNLVEVAYTEDGGEAIAAGTAITASTLVFLTPDVASQDLYAVLAWTSGRVLVRCAPIPLNRFAIDLVGNKFSN